MGVIDLNYSNFPILLRLPYPYEEGNKIILKTNSGRNFQASLLLLRLESAIGTYPCLLAPIEPSAAA